MIVWDPAAKKQHFIRRATFSGGARDFGFLVPTPGVPALASVGDEVFDRMRSATTRRTEYRTEKAIDWTPLLLMASRPRSAGEAVPTGRAPVEVLSTQKIAGYEAAVLDATDAEALNQWLAGNGYATTPDLTAWLSVYVTQRWIVSAFKIDKSVDALTAQTSAVLMSFNTDQPFFPYREPASQRDGPTEPRVLKVWFVGPERVTGRIGERSWPGQMYWSENVENLDVGGIQIPATVRLTAFEDHATPRPGFDDLYFHRDADQREVVPPPLVETEIDTTHIPADLVLAPMMVVGLVWWRRRSRSRSRMSGP